MMLRKLPILVCTLALLAGFACSKNQRSGFARVVASTARSAIAIDRIAVQILSGTTLIAAHDLVASGGTWQDTLSDIPVGTYTFQADAYAAGSTVSSFTGTALNVPIAANTVALVNIVLHQTGAPVSVSGPSIGFVTASTQTPQEGQGVLLAASATGTGTLTYTWSALAGSFSSPGSTNTAIGPTATWYAPNTTGSQSLTLTVTDGTGNIASLSFALSVIVGQGSATVNVFLPPQITSLSAMQASATQAQWQLSLVVAEPPDNGTLTYAWTSDPGCPAGSAFSVATVQQPTFTFASAGVCKLTVTVTDPSPSLTSGNYPYATGSITVSGNAATIEFGPTITLGSQSLAAAAGGQTVYFAVSAQDNNSPAQSLTYSWSASAGSPTEGSGAAFTWTAPSCLSTGGSTITATASNGTLSTSQPFTVVPAAGSSCAQPKSSVLAVGSGWACGIASSDRSIHCAGDTSVLGAPPAGSFTQVMSGSKQQLACALDSSGLVQCWGNDNGYGIIANVPAANKFRQLGMGSSNCGVHTDGTSECWAGISDYGVAAGLPSGNFIAFAVTDSGGACGMHPDNTVQCWSGGNGGPLLSPSGTFKQISSGGYQGVCGVRSDTAIQCFGNSYQPFVFTSSDTGYVQAIEAGYFYYCGLKLNGTLSCAGRWNPANYLPAASYVQIAGVQNTLCGIDASGTGTCVDMLNDGSSVSSTSTYSLGAGLLVP